MSNVVQYTDMKDSGSKWIGAIPKNWRIRALKYIFSIEKRIAGKLGHTVLSVTQRGIKPKDMTERGQFAFDYSKYQLVHAGDFVMNHMDLLTGWVDISHHEGVTSPDYRVFINTHPDQYISEYYKYIFQLCYSNRIFYGLGQGVAGFGRWRLPADMFLNFSLPVPPTEEQRAIAKFLNEKCNSIDALIAESKSIIVEQKQWRASIIQEAVTKGMLLDAPKKKSQLEWIEEIPKSWETARLKVLFTFGKGLPITKDNLVDSGVPVISYGQIHSKTNTGTSITDDLIRYVPETYLTTNPESLAKKYDLLMADTSEDLNGCGNCVYVDKDSTLFAGYHTIILHSINKRSNKYLAYLFKSDAWRSQIRTRVSGVKLFSISRKILNALTVILPPDKERKQIVEYLDRKCELIDSIIAEKETLISELEKYKHSLIYETVTGKRKVV